MTTSAQYQAFRANHNSSLPTSAAIEDWGRVLSAYAKPSQTWATRLNAFYDSSVYHAILGNWPRTMEGALPGALEAFPFLSEHMSKWAGWGDPNFAVLPCPHCGVPLPLAKDRAGGELQFHPELCYPLITPDFSPLYVCRFCATAYSGRNGPWARLANSNVYVSQALRERTIRQYSYNVLDSFPIQTHKKALPTDLIMGVELEVAYKTIDPMTSAQTVDYLRETIRVQELLGACILKTDGSIPTHGVEIVTAPAPRAWHAEAWGRLLTDPHFHENWRAHETCGLHVHMDRSQISVPLLAKLLTFYNAADMLVPLTAVARREQGPQVRWCKTNGKLKAKDVYNLPRDRYTALNTTKPNTAEVRIFASTTNLQEFMACLELVEGACDFCYNASFRSITAENFYKFIHERSNGYPNLSPIMRKKIPAYHALHKRGGKKKSS